MLVQEITRYNREGVKKVIGTGWKRERGLDMDQGSAKIVSGVVPN